MRCLWLSWSIFSRNFLIEKWFKGALGGIALLVTLTACEQQSLHLLDGASKPWQEYRGRWVLINYWAEWCQPCRQEMPELNQLHKLYSDRVVVLGVNYDHPQKEELQRQIESMGVEFPVLTRDPAQLLGYVRPLVLPTTLVFNPQGELQQTLIGPQKLELLTRITLKVPVAQ